MGWPHAAACVPCGADAVRTVLLARGVAGVPEGMGGWVGGHDVLSGGGGLAHVPRWQSTRCILYMPHAGYDCLGGDSMCRLAAARAEGEGSLHGHRNSRG